MTIATISNGETVNSVTVKLNELIGIGNKALLNDAANVITEANAAALAVGANGATNPALQVDTSAENVATGVKVTGAAAAGGVTIAAISSGTDENLTLAAKGTGSVVIAKADINGGAIDGVTIGTASAVTDLRVDNLKLDGNTLSSTDTNGNIVLAPNGTGDVQLDADTVRVGDSNADVTLTSNGTGDLILSTNSGTNSGVVRIYDGADGNITLTPNGTGRTVVAALSATSPRVTTGIDDANGKELLKVTATADAVNELTLANAATEGSPTLSATGDDTNIDITLTPKGSGRVVITQASMTSPRVTTGINDSAGNELLKVTATGSAVNELTLANAATGNNPVLSATGTDDNIGITLTPKGTGSVVISKADINGGTIDGTTLGSTCIYVVPNVDPEVAGALWNNNGTLAISAGA